MKNLSNALITISKEIYSLDKTIDSLEVNNVLKIVALPNNKEGFNNLIIKLRKERRFELNIIPRYIKITKPKFDKLNSLKINKK